MEWKRLNVRSSETYKLNQYMLIHWDGLKFWGLYSNETLNSESEILRLPYDTPEEEAQQRAIEHIKETLPNSKRKGEWA